MENNALPLRLDELFFPLQEVRANPEHDPSGNRFGTQINHSTEATPIEGAPGTYGVSLNIESNRESSDNPPYLFALHAYAIIYIDPQIDPATQHAIALTNGQIILVGAVRERLLDLTSRAPWGRFLLAAIPLSAKDPS